MQLKVISEKIRVNIFPENASRETCKSTRKKLKIHPLLGKFLKNFGSTGMVSSAFFPLEGGDGSEQLHKTDAGLARP